MILLPLSISQVLVSLAVAGHAGLSRHSLATAEAKRRRVDLLFQLLARGVRALRRRWFARNLRSTGRPLGRIPVHSRRRPRRLRPRTHGTCPAARPGPPPRFWRRRVGVTLSPLPAWSRPSPDRHRPE